MVSCDVSCVCVLSADKVGQLQESVASLKSENESLKQKVAVSEG